MQRRGRTPRARRAHPLPQRDCHSIGAAATDNWPPARSFDDYVVRLDGTPLTQLVTTVDVG